MTTTFDLTRDFHDQLAKLQASAPAAPAGLGAEERARFESRIDDLETQRAALQKRVDAPAPNPRVQELEEALADARGEVARLQKQLNERPGVPGPDPRVQELERKLEAHKLRESELARREKIREDTWTAETNDWKQRVKDLESRKPASDSGASSVVLTLKAALEARENDVKERDQLLESLGQKNETLVEQNKRLQNELIAQTRRRQPGG